MKRLYATFIALLCVSGLQAQNGVYVINHAQSQTVCDGTAYTDLGLPAPMWTYYWYQDSTLIQTGADTVSNLCPGDYTLTADSMGTAIASYQFHVYSLQDDTLDGYTEVFYFGGSYGQGNVVCTSGVPPMTGTCEGVTATSYAYYDPAVNGTNYANLLVFNGPQNTAGLHSVFVSDAVGDTMTFTFAIPDSTNWYGNVSDSSFTDTLGGTFMVNCDFNYSTIDSAWLSGVTDIGNNYFVLEWSVLDGGNTSAVVDTIYYDSLSGENFLAVVTMYCPTKSTSNTIGVYGQFFKDNNGVHLGIDKKEQLHIAFGPNPFSNELKLALDETPTDIDIFSSDGKLMKKCENMSGKVVLDLSNLRSGIYLMQLSNQNGSRLLKIQK